MKEESEALNSENQQLKDHCEELENYAQNLSLELEDVKSAIQEL